MKTSKVAVAAAASAVLILPGCGIAMGSERHDEQKFDAPDKALTVDTDHDVVIEVSDDEDGAVVLDQRGAKDMDAAWSDATLTLRADHRWFDFGNNRSTVRVPAGRAVTVRSSNGDVKLVDVADGVEVKSDNGDVSLEDVSGAVRVETQNGDIDVETDGTPDRIDLVTANGDISTRVSGDTAYHVETDTDSGDIAVDVATSPDSPHLISATTNSGDISIEP